MTTKELLDILYQIQECDNIQLDSIKPLDENKYELSIYYGRRLYSKKLVVHTDTGVTSSNYYDDIKQMAMAIVWDTDEDS